MSTNNTLQDRVMKASHPPDYSPEALLNGVSYF